ncbi:MAG: alpha-ketoacid dehydrogenase subunit beta [Vicinamibacterales bacterium]
MHVDQRRLGRVARSRRVPRSSDSRAQIAEIASSFALPSPQEAPPTRELTYIGAISDALREEMRRDPDVFLIGEDIAGDFGGAFKVTKGFEAEFGPRRVINTPIAELGFTAMATGMALMGLRPVIEMQFADFISSAFDSIVQFAATNYYRWNGPVPWVIRAPSDGGIRSGPFHSQNPEAWFAHAPGLKVVAPGTPADAKGLLIAAIRDNNPVVYFESKALYRTQKAHVPEGAYVVPIGKANLVRSGEDVSIITYGTQLREALTAADRLQQDGVSCDVLDLRTLKPLDVDAVLSTARKTGKVIIVHSANQFVGLGAEIAALIAQHAFEWLDAPVMRLGGLDVPVPFSPPLEDAYRPNAEKIYRASLELAKY